MLCTLQTWNLFGGSTDDIFRWFCGWHFYFSPLGFFLSLQPAGLCHSCLLKKVAGFLRSMLCTLQTWNLFGGSVVDTFRWFLSIFPHWVFFFSPSSVQESLTPTCCRRLQVSFDPCFARCKHGTCSVVLWSILLGGSCLLFPHWGFSPSSLQESHSYLLKKVAGCLRFMSLHAANMEPVRMRFGGPCGWWADPDNSTKAQVDRNGMP